MSRATAEYVTARAADLRAKSTAAFGIAISENPEKVRAMLNLWLVPKFKPTFYDENTRFFRGLSTTSGLDDIELLDPSYSSAAAEPGGRETQFPVRMINLKTKRLVEYPSVGFQGQYCVLSHSWKGREVDYRYIADANFKAFTRALTATGASKYSSEGIATNTSTPNDIDTIRHQCELDIAAQKERIKSLAHESDLSSNLGLGETTDLVEELLSLRVDVLILEKGHDGHGGLEKAKAKLAEASAASDYEKMENDVFKQFLGDIGLGEDKVAKVINPTEYELEKSRKVADAEKILSVEKKKQSEEAEKIEFFKHHSHVREAIDGLIDCLQRSKSITKVEKAIERSKEIFDNNPFSKTENQYLWVDSCCINRADDGEYVKSISAMGEWYKNAEFCLIHLDTPRNVPKDSLEDWNSLKSGRSSSLPNITRFADIVAYKPEWSTRAWTLQELVMSKATFYVNSSWMPLPRPVENLGSWYYLCPFISLYTSVDTNNPYSSILNGDRSTILLEKALNSGNEDRLKNLDRNEEDTAIALEIIGALQTMDLRIPRDIDMETARARITQSVYVAVSSLTAPSEGPISDARRLLDQILEALQPHLSSTRDYSLAERARYTINILLRCLVDLIELPILYDRTYVADFGKVPNLELWRKGLIRSRFSTHKAMSLLCGRDSTVVTDRAYCLMGMLGVRFPTFPAEGLTKALSRLLDEVLISSNDVSVFNWTGKQYGSPIRGRSLYPSLPEAYEFSKDEERKKEKDRKLAELLQLERYDKMTDFLAITGMLVDAIMFVKNRQRKNIPLLWVMEIIRVIKRAEFEILRPHITNIGKILKYIETAFDSSSTVVPNTINMAATSHAETPATVVGEATSKQGEASFSPVNSFPSQMKTPSLPKDMMSFRAPKFGRKKTDTEPAPPKASSPLISSRGIGSFKAPSLKGFGRKDSEISQSNSTLAEVMTPTNEPDIISLPPTTISDNSRHHLDDEVLSYIKRIGGIRKEGEGEDEGVKNATSEPELPLELGKVLADIPAREFTKPYVKPEEIDSMISPNPIIVKNSGIEGLFDIQRVIVSMAQPEKLRRQIRNAVSPQQKITNWCIISTGFAMVLVSFSCPKFILEKELDILQEVESKVLGGNYQEGSDGNGEVSEGGPPKHNQVSVQTMGTAWQRTIANRISTPKSNNEDTNEEPGEPNFEQIKTEGARVSRMIKFVQESDLTEVAGEWVLARFSGVPGAKWFLCHLELGGSGRDFYGHRIATDEIDFRNASPETGLLKYWEYYMMQKKYRLCSILQKLMDSKDWGNLKTEMGQNIAKKVAKEIQDDDSEDDSDGEGDDGGLSGTLKELGGMALTMAGAGLVQQFYERWADRLLKNLSADVLKKFPTHMQTAMESLDDNKDLMPSMFHSAKKIHMF